MTPSISPALDKDALFAKSKVYASRALAAQARDKEEYRLWASLGLELLGKACLAAVHPALIADPMDADSLFAACGRPLSADIRTITAKTLFDRLGRIEKAFDSKVQGFCKQIALHRNAELHSGESPFSGVSDMLWEQAYWGAISTILVAMNESLEDWLGTSQAAAPKALIEQARRAVTAAVASRIERSRAIFEATHKSKNSKRDALAKSQSDVASFPQKMLRDQYDGYNDVSCPACNCSAVLGGRLWSEDIVDVSFDESLWETVEMTYLAEEFQCPACGLRLTGSMEISAAALPQEFTEMHERQREFEPEYGND